jgi:hypothetical protein
MAELIGRCIAEVVDGLAQSGEDNVAAEAEVRETASRLTAAFPIY